MSQWYISYDGNNIGPLSIDEARQHAASRPEGFCWKEGFAEWVPIRQVAELNAATPGAMPTPPPVGRTAADEIDFKIVGESMQFVEVELDPGESAIAEAGAMMYKTGSVGMQTIFGDGSAADQQSGIMGKLLGAGKRIITGESLFTTVFTNNAPSGKQHVAFAAPYPGMIIPVTLSNFGGTLICQKDSFLAAAKGVSIGIHFQKKIMTGLFGGEGFIMQKLDGDGQAFLHAGGTIVEKELQAGEVMEVDTGCLVALTKEVQYDVQMAGGVKTMLFGGEGMFLVRLQGPGKVWLQSLPFSRLAGRMLQAAPASQGGGGKSVGEGSLLNHLGGLGNLLDGDNSF